MTVVNYAYLIVRVCNTRTSLLHTAPSDPPRPHYLHYRTRVTDPLQDLSNSDPKLVEALPACNMIFKISLMRPNATCIVKMTITGEWNPFEDNHISDFEFGRIITKTAFGLRCMLLICLSIAPILGQVTKLYSVLQNERKCSLAAELFIQAPGTDLNGNLIANQQSKKDQIFCALLKTLSYI